ncbi:HAD family hydrolase [Paenibacillus herberti]|uniref:HAD family hydrolase n=1 Tax=Paenibacillus herberti TaxID=1619309 RepID=A0A229NXU9_9BACL|nr:HAD-IA family hydrolase [Paenibacillus herberti]OXM14723.1 HAD family hydrolase [Paenibacillus herberti]
MSIKAVVFDFDGLIIDTETPSYEAFDRIYREHGAELPLETFAQCVGTSFAVFDPYDYLEKTIGRPLERQLIQSRYNEIYTEIVHESTVLPGVRENLQRARELGLAVGLASSSSWSWIEPLLKAHDLKGYFNSFQMKDKVKRIKPDPELYLASLAALEVQGYEAVSFEDSLHGFTAARAAGLRTVVIPNSVTRHMSFPGADVQLESMADMKLDELLALIERRSNNQLI